MKSTLASKTFWVKDGKLQQYIVWSFGSLLLWMWSDTMMMQFKWRQSTLIQGYSWMNSKITIHFCSWSPTFVRLSFCCCWKIIFIKLSFCHEMHWRLEVCKFLTSLIYYGQLLYPAFLHVNVTLGFCCDYTHMLLHYPEYEYIHSRLKVKPNSNKGPSYYQTSHRSKDFLLAHEAACVPLPIWITRWSSARRCPGHWSPPPGKRSQTRREWKTSWSQDNLTIGHLKNEHL